MHTRSSLSGMLAGAHSSLTQPKPSVKGFVFEESKNDEPMWFMWMNLTTVSGNVCYLIFTPFLCLVTSVTPRV